MRITISYALVVASAIIGLAGCSVSTPSAIAPRLGARPYAPDPRFWSNESQSIVPKEMLDQGPNGAKLILRGPPAVANAGVYVAQFMEPTIGDYEVPDYKNAGPFCSVRDQGGKRYWRSAENTIYLHTQRWFEIRRHP